MVHSSYDMESTNFLHYALQTWSPTIFFPNQLNILPGYNNSLKAKYCETKLWTEEQNCIYLVCWSEATYSKCIRHHFLVISIVFILFYCSESKVLELFFLFQVDRRYLVLSSGSSSSVSCRSYFSVTYIKLLEIMDFCCDVKWPQNYPWGMTEWHDYPRL